MTTTRKSRCTGKTTTKCRKTPGCFSTKSGKRRSYCRKTLKRSCSKIGYVRCSRRLGCKRTKSGIKKAHCISARR